MPSPVFSSLSLQPHSFRLHLLHPHLLIIPSSRFILVELFLAILIYLSFFPFPHETPATGRRKKKKKQSQSVSTMSSEKCEFYPPPHLLLQRRTPANIYTKDGAILDAGSSGTRIHIYRWQDPVQAHAKASKAQLSALPKIITKKKWAKKIHPGS